MFHAAQEPPSPGDDVTIQAIKECADWCFPWLFISIHRPLVAGNALLQRASRRPAGIRCRADLRPMPGLQRDSGAVGLHSRASEEAGDE